MSKTMTSQTLIKSTCWSNNSQYTSPYLNVVAISVSSIQQIDIVKVQTDRKIYHRIKSPFYLILIVISCMFEFIRRPYYSYLLLRVQNSMNSFFTKREISLNLSWKISFFLIEKATISVQLIFLKKKERKIMMMRFFLGNILEIELIGQ